MYVKTDKLADMISAAQVDAEAKKALDLLLNKVSHNKEKCSEPTDEVDGKGLQSEWTDINHDKIITNVDGDKGIGVSTQNNDAVGTSAPSVDAGHSGFIQPIEGGKNGFITSVENGNNRFLPTQDNGNGGFLDSGSNGYVPPIESGFLPPMDGANNGFSTNIDSGFLPPMDGGFVPIDNRNGPPMDGGFLPIDNRNGPPMDGGFVPIDNRNGPPMDGGFVPIDNRNGPPMDGGFVPIDNRNGPPMDGGFVPIDNRNGPPMDGGFVPIDNRNGPPMDNNCGFAPPVTSNTAEGFAPLSGNPYMINNYAHMPVGEEKRTYQHDRHQHNNSGSHTVTSYMNNSHNGSTYMGNSRNYGTDYNNNGYMNKPQSSYNVKVLLLAPLLLHNGVPIGQGGRPGMYSVQPSPPPPYGYNNNKDMEYKNMEPGYTDNDRGGYAEASTENQRYHQCITQNDVYKAPIEKPIPPCPPKPPPPAVAPKPMDPNVSEYPFDFTVENSYGKSRPTVLWRGTLTRNGKKELKVGFADMHGDVRSFISKQSSHLDIKHKITLSNVPVHNVSGIFYVFLDINPQAPADLYSRESSNFDDFVKFFTKKERSGIIRFEQEASDETAALIYLVPNTAPLFADVVKAYRMPPATDHKHIMIGIFEFTPT